MTKRVGVGLIVLAVAGVAFWFWWSRRAAETPATSTVTQPMGAVAAQPPTPSSTSAAALARVTIKVASDKGPIADAAVRFAPEDGEVIVLRTGADGSVRADQLAPGEWTISASAAGFEPAAAPAKNLTAGEDATIALTLTAGGRPLTGLVTDATGGPIAGARIDAAKLGGRARPGDAVATTVTGSDGMYAVTASEGQVLVAVSSVDYAAQSRLVEVGATGAVANFSLVPGGAIEGIVRDETTKQPVAGAQVIAERDRGGMILLAESSRRRALSGADGRFRVTSLRPGAYELAASAGTRTSKSPTIVGIGVAEQVSDIEILISDGPVISGTVVDETGTAVADIEVTASGRGRGGDAKTDAKGAFTITGLPPGAYFLMGRNDTFVPAGGAQVELADKDVTGVKVKVQRGAKIVGHVEPRQICEIEHDIDDRELGAGMPMVVGPKTTAADGEFALGPASAGKAQLRARCPSGAQGSMPIDVTVGMAPLVLKVTPGASIAGRVVDGDGKPVAGATVMASLEGPTQRTMIVNGMVTSGVQGISGSDGTYVLVGLAAGSYDMSVLDRGRPLRMRGARVQVKLAATDKKTGVDLAVDRPNGVIKGVVMGPDKKPLADAWVSVQQDLDAMLEGIIDRERGRGPGSGPGPRPAGGGEERSSRMTIESRDDDNEGAIGAGFAPALTDAQGRFEITGLPHSRYEVIAEAEAGKLRGRASNVTPDAAITIQVDGVTSLSGTVRSASGPTPVFALELIGPTTAARSFTDGTFQIARVDPGSYIVKVTSSQGNAETKVEVRPGQPATVEITLVANAIVVGKLVDVKEQPVAGAAFTVVPESTDGRLQVSLEGPPPTTGPDGSFRLETQAGKGVLVVLMQPVFTKKGLVLEAGKTLDLGTVKVVPEAPLPH